MDKQHATFAALIEAFTTLTAGFSLTERNKLFHHNAERIYRL